MNLGQPIVLNGSSPFSKGIRKLGDGLATDDLLPKAGRRSFGRMMKAMLPPFGRTNGQAPAAQRTTKGKETPK